MVYRRNHHYKSNKNAIIEYPRPKIVHSPTCKNKTSKLPIVYEECKSSGCYLAPLNNLIPFDKTYLYLNCGLSFHDALNRLNLSYEQITLSINALSESILEALNSKKFKIAHSNSRGKWKLSGKLENFKNENGVWIMYATDCHLSNNYITLLSQRLKLKLYSLESG